MTFNLYLILSQQSCIIIYVKNMGNRLKQLHYDSLRQNVNKQRCKEKSFHILIISLPDNIIHFSNFSCHLVMMCSISMSTMVHTKKMSYYKGPVLSLHLWNQVLHDSIVDCVQVLDVKSRERDLPVKLARKQFSPGRASHKRYVFPLSDHMIKNIILSDRITIEICASINKGWKAT